MTLTRHELSEAWATLAPRLLKYARSWAPEFAEDLVQELAVILLKDDLSFQGSAPLEAWCKRRLRWMALDAYEQNRRRERWFSREKAFRKSLTKSAWSKGKDDNDLGSIIKAVQDLPVRSREVVLKRIYGLTTAEIAKDMSIEESTVRSIWRYAKSQLEEGVIND